MSDAQRNQTGANYASGETPRMMLQRLAAEAEVNGNKDGAERYKRMTSYIEDEAKKNQSN